VSAAGGGVLLQMVFVVAVADNGVIGRDNARPWRLKSDLKRFKALTLGKPVIMGRKTFLSIGRPLPGRTNIVVTRDGKFQVPGVIVARSLDAALDVARGDALRRFASEIMVIGGAEIFAQWLDRADRLEVTHIHAQPDGDAFLDVLRAPDPVRWDETARARNAAGADDSADFTYATYIRRAGINPVSRCLH